MKQPLAWVTPELVRRTRYCDRRYGRYEEYYPRIDAMSFALAHGDGQSTGDLDTAMSWWPNGQPIG